MIYLTPYLLNKDNDFKWYQCDIIFRDKLNIDTKLGVISIEKHSNWLLNIHLSHHLTIIHQATYDTLDECKNEIEDFMHDYFNYGYIE